MRGIAALLLSAAACHSSSPQPQGSPPQGSPDALPAGVRGSVLQHHANASRDGVYTDAAMTRTAARNLRQDLFFSAPLQGPLDAQLLYSDGGDGGQDLLLAFTERNEVIAFDPISGRRIWSRVVAAPVARSLLPCGIIDPIGITGTPIIDPATQVLHLDAMTTPDGGATKRHIVYSLSLRDGSDAHPPVDIQANVPGFNSAVQNERGALALLGGRVFVPFAGHVGDCEDFRGWVVAIDPTGAQPVTAFRTGGRGGGIWGMTGVAVADGAAFVATGNTIGTATFRQGEAILKFSAGGFPAFEFFAPANWAALDATDADLGGSGAIALDVAGSPARQIVIALGKDGKAYLVDRANLGGIGGPSVFSSVAAGAIITAPSAINTPAGTFLAFTGSGTACPGSTNGIVGLRITPSPLAVATAWCAGMRGRGSTLVTTTGAGAESIVWAVGAEGDGLLHAVAADTGETIFAGGQIGPVSRFGAPIVAKGRLYVAGNSAVHAFTVR